MVRDTLFVHQSPLDTNWVSEIRDDSPALVARKYSLVKSGLNFWASKTYSQRAKCFLELVRILEANRSQINGIIRMETGKTIPNCEGEFDAAISMLRILTAYEFFPSGSVLPSKNEKRFSYSLRSPYGITFLIFPSNAPLPNFIWKLAPALMAGNVVLAKSSPYTGKTFDFLISLMREAGFGDEILQRVDGEEGLLKQVLNLGLGLVSFTGSTTAGARVAELVGPSLSKLVLECGGVNPFIVDETADLEKAIPVFCESAFGNSGQRCAAASVLLIHESIQDVFIEKLENYLSGFTTGLEENCRFGPMCSPRYVSRLHQAIYEREESEVIRLTTLTSSNDFVFQPSIVRLAGEDTSSFENELYGPVCRFGSFKSFESVISLVNASPFGLTSAVWSDNRKSIETARANLRYGVVNINGPTFGSEPNFPFGGYRLSGNGSKEAGYNCIEEYSTSRVISEFSVHE